MINPQPFSIDSLESYQEGKRLEVKSAKGGLPNSLWETYSAFANSEGGVIVLGVRECENGKLQIEGVKNAVKLLKDFWNLINNRQKVSTNILTDRLVKIESVDGKEILVIRVPRADRTTRPVYVGMDPRLGSFRRNGEGDYHCSIEEVTLMLRDASPMTEDYKLLTNLDYSVFCPDTIRAYRNIFRLIHEDHHWNHEDDEIFMRRIGAVREDKETGRFHPTAAGLLMFGYESEILTEFPQYFLDYQEHRSVGIYARWSDRITSQTGDWSGNVFDFLLKVVPKLQADFKVPFVLNGNHAVKDTPIHKVVREAMVNMLSNADFYGRRGVVVRKNIDGFMFANPGNMRVSLNEALHDNMSDPRNSVIMKMLALVEYGERAGSGLQGIFMAWEKVYHTSPKIEVSSTGVDRTTLLLPYSESQPDVTAMKELYDVSMVQECTPEYTRSTPRYTISAQQVHENKEGYTISTQETTAQKLLRILRDNPAMTLSEAAKMVGSTRDGIRRIVYKLRADGRLIREGSTKAGLWIVKDTPFDQ